MAKSKAKSKAKSNEYFERDFSGGTLRLYESDNNYSDYYGTISLECGFAIRISVVYSKKNKSYFISYPSYKTKNNEYANLAFCFDNEVIEELNELVNEMIED